MNAHEQKMVESLRRQIEALHAELGELRATRERPKPQTAALLWDRRIARRIPDIVAEAFGCNPAEIVSTSHCPPVVMKRHIAMHLCTLAGLSRTDIAKAFRCHRSSVLYALDRVSEMRAEDKWLNRVITRLGQRVRDEMEAMA